MGIFVKKRQTNQPLLAETCMLIMFQDQGESFLQRVSWTSATVELNSFDVCSGWPIVLRHKQI